jgi:hypothetical protein
MSSVDQKLRKFFPTIAFRMSVEAPHGRRVARQFFRRFSKSIISLMLCNHWKKLKEIGAAPNQRLGKSLGHGTLPSFLRLGSEQSSAGRPKAEKQ